MEKIKLAIIGYGAMSELYHLPAAMNSDNVEVVGVYDLNQDRLETMVGNFQIPYYGSDYRKDIQNFDAAIVAVPNFLHAEISVDLMKNGKHVLVEKPMGLSYYECQEMLEVSQKENVILSVGHVRKLYPENIFIKRLIENRILGEVSEVIINEGNIFSWPMASKSFLDKKVCGGGVLVDIGIHIIDLLAWWFGELECIEYFDDSFGGVESDCSFRLSAKISSRISVLISRQRLLPNKIKIIFEKGMLTCGTGFNSKLSLIPNDDLGYSFLGMIKTNKNYDSFETIIREQIDNFACSIFKKENDIEAVKSAMKAVEIVEACFNNKKQINYNWETV